MTAVLNLHAIPRHSKGASRISVGELKVGQGRNIIPPNAIFKMETRGETSEINEYMVSEANRIIVSAAQMYNVDYHIEVAGEAKSGASSLEMKDIVKKVEDFTHLMTEVQNSGGIGTYIMIGAECLICLIS